MKLVVVESPNKIKKIKGYLGPEYHLIATVGHFRDLPQRDLCVDLATMHPTYQVDPSKQEVVERLRAEAGRAAEILIATDPDREGEAIGWHVAQVLELGDRAKRIVFQEITKNALAKAVSSPRPIDQKLVDAQQARRVLDRVVGYKVSPLIQVLGRGLSAGRVQTATLHIVCQRERERLAFKAEAYSVLKVKYANGMVSELADEKGKPSRPRDQALTAAAAARAKLSPHEVVSVERKEADRKAPPPFTTSSLQQAASARLGFDPARTMKIAQALFEAGHISYHRSDSVNLSDEAVNMAREWIAAHHPASLPEAKPKYRSKDGAQEAHEAIRPTALGPVELAGDERALYNLIRARFLASQMKPARVATTLVLTRAQPGAAGDPDFFFAARGTEVLEPHWLALELEEEEEKGKGKDDEVEDQKLPTVQRGDRLEVADVTVDARETKPPARFTEAGLVKEMERLGIGRPSTYAATIATLYRRAYVERQRKAVAPTELGMKVDEFMLAGLTELTSHEYTARMEQDLDRIAEGTLAWDAYLKDWWDRDFKPRLAAAAKTWGEMIRLLRAATAPVDPAAPACPTCGKPMLRRMGKTGEFWGCRAYPACKKTMPIEITREGGKKCPRCGQPMIPRKGSRGPFMGCAGYPRCRYTEEVEVKKPEPGTPEDKAEKGPPSGR